MRIKTAILGCAFLMALAICFGWAVFRSGTAVQAGGGKPEFTSRFDTGACKFKSKGENEYMILRPGHQLILEGIDDDELVRVEITVLREKETLNINGIGRVKARVVEEREFADGELTEVSRNFFAMCKDTQDIYYFGEDVDNYEDGELVDHEGAWRAGVDGATPGILMPGTFLLGSRYYQEVAPGIALDRGEHVGSGITLQTPAGTFHNCVEVEETSPLDEPGETSTKIYAPGIGMIVDDEITLVAYHSEAKKRR